jgi:two-component system OmpR family response regulator
MRILVVEDNPRIEAVLRKGLSEEGYAVDSAFDGEAGLEAALAGGYDALVVDVMLPRRDGVELVRALREAGSGVPVLLLTARDRTEDKIAGLDAGADDYLTKPFDFSELTARLRALLRRATPAAPAVLEVGDLSLDPATREVRRAGEPVSLTPKEFALLEFLMRNPERALSRTAIMERVWGIRFDPGTNVVDVFINALRNKLDPERTRILTVRGVGYLLRAPGAEAP